jgi:predicted regulator of Ras-like GTPase activity (Roadblock/LC7/MglB family)
MASNDLSTIIEQFRAEVPQFVSTDIVGIEDGISIAGGSINPDFDSSVASAYYADVAKANNRALEALGGPSAVGSTEDILITTTNAYILLSFPHPKFYHGLAITRQGNLGMARMIMKKYSPAIRDACAKLAG